MQWTYTVVNRFKPNVPTGFRTHPATYSVGIEGCFLGIKWKACEADHLPLNSLKVKNKWSNSFIPCMPPWNAEKQFYLCLFTLQVCAELHVGLPVRHLLFLSHIGEMHVFLKAVGQTETLTESKVTFVYMVTLQNVHKIKLRYFHML